MENDSISSTTNTIYTKVVTKIERFSQLAHFILMRVALGVIVLPPIFVNYFKYYVLGFGDASFQDFTLMYGN